VKRAEVRKRKNRGFMAEEKWIQGAIKNKGSLRKSLHVKKGEKIPASKLKKAEHSKNPTTRKRAVLAETLKKMHKK
jgi:hypothetical protein